MFCAMSGFKLAKSGFGKSESIKVLRNGGQTKWHQKACGLRDELKTITVEP